MSHSSDPLFQSYRLGPLELPNRVIMAPLTRSRAAQPGDVPSMMNAEYYRQRADVGLIISEATQVSPQGKGYAFTPGIHSAAQVDGWRLVTDAVHEAGGLIHLQLWHVGRISRPELQPNGDTPVAPSPIRPLPGVVEQFRRGAENAKRAGFDGVELHGANGYLIDQFLRSGTNQRSDGFGGSVENRLRFPLMVVDAVIEVWGADRVGIRLSPTGSFNDMKDDDPIATFGEFAKRLNERGIAYVEVVEDSFQGNHANGRPEAIIDAIRAGYTGTYIANGDYDAEQARRRLADGRCDLVSFGRPIISNPDLVERLRSNAPLNEWDASTFYGGDEHGYTDYPTLTDPDRTRSQA
jgi:N-ethylmaleimide reductase